MSKWKPICENCKEAKRYVATLCGLQFCKVCLTEALMDIEEQKAQPKSEDDDE